MILYASSSLFLSPKKWLRATALIPSQARPGWSLLQTPEGLHASMLPTGAWQASSANDGPYEQCKVDGQNLVFMPRDAGEDQVVPVVLDL